MKVYVSGGQIDMRGPRKLSEEQMEIVIFRSVELHI
jgi:hypothetical protein